MRASAAETHLDHSRRSRLARVFLIAPVALTLLTSCSPGSPNTDETQELLPDISIADFSDVKATLNFETGTATTPIDAYLTNTDFETELLYSQAYEALITGCMSDAGLTYEGLTLIDWDTLQPQEDRLFGQWDRTSAAQRGSMLNDARGIPKSTSVEQGVEFNRALDACHESVTAGEMLAPLAEELTQPTLADRIYGNSAVRAQETREGKAATARFTECLENKSLVVDPDSGYVSADYGELGAEADITSALGEADCNVDTGRVQKLYDITSQYISAYMVEYEAQLKEVLERKQVIHHELQAIIDDVS